MRIHTATADDIPSLVDMAVAFRNHLGRAIPTREQFACGITALQSSPDAEFLVATRHCVAAGYVLLRFRHSMWACGIEATIEDLFVDPAARQAGIGRALIQFALQTAAEKSCVSVCLDTNENNAASNAIYSSLGFQTISARWSGRQLFFRKTLRESQAPA